MDVCCKLWTTGTDGFLNLYKMLSLHVRGYALTICHFGRCAVSALLSGTIAFPIFSKKKNGIKEVASSCLRATEIITQTRTVYTIQYNKIQYGNFLETHQTIHTSLAGLV